MKSKGQLTIEFFFVFVYLMAIIGMIFILADNLSDGQTKIHIRSQETKIANSLSKIISSTKGFEAGDSFTVEYSIPEIRIAAKVVELPCNITITGSAITVEAVYNDQPITARVPANINIAFITDTTPECGGKLVMRKV